MKVKYIIIIVFIDYFFLDLLRINIFIYDIAINIVYDNIIIIGKLD